MSRSIDATAAPVEAQASLHDDYSRLLMARDRMNLAAVRVRAQDLQKTMTLAIFDLETAPERYDWSNVLERFAVMNSQLHSITAQMVPLMEHYIVHPKAVDQQTAPVMPIMLASKLLPEQEAQNAQQLQALQQQHGNQSSSQQAGHVQRMSESLDRLVDHLVLPQAGNPKSGLLDLNKGTVRREIARTSCVPARQAAATSQRSASQQRPAGKLEGPDLFLAIATKGHGLVNCVQPTS